MPIENHNDHRFTACSVASALAVLGDGWTFLIMREAYFGVRRFGQFARNLDIARNMLSDRLSRLVHNGLLEKVRYRSDPDWYEYRLTEAGRDLYPAIVALMRWGDRHLHGDRPPLQLRHTTCGQTTEPYMACSSCREPIEARAIEATPGPGAHEASPLSSDALPLARPRHRRARRSS